MIESTPANTPAQLNYCRIRERASELSLSYDFVCAATGLRGHAKQDPDQRTVTLAVLGRLHSLLGLALTELVIINDPITHGPQATETPPAAITATTANGDAHALLSVLASGGGASVQTLLQRLGWTSQRLTAAVAMVRTQLEGTALQVYGTDLRMALALRPGALPARARDQFLSEKTRRTPLTAALAGDLLRLVRRKILEPFPGEPLSLRAEPSIDRDRRTMQLLSRRIATGPGTRAGDDVPLYMDELRALVASNDTVAGLRIHPDVLFALGLAEEPELPDSL